MKKLQLLGAIILTCVQLAAADDQADTTRAKIGSPAPDFSCQTLDGTPFSLSKEKGKVVLINFFATWCGPCLQELPHLEKEIYQKYSARKDFQLIVIGREHDAAELTKFVSQKGFKLPIAPDKKREIYEKYAEKYIPRNFVIGKDGVVKLASTGYTAESFDELGAVLKNELER